MAGAISRQLRRTNLWRERTNLRTWAERLTGVGPPVVAHRMVRSSLAQSWKLPAWPSTLQGDTGNENLRQPHFDDVHLPHHFLGIHGSATSTSTSHDGAGLSRGALVHLVSRNGLH